MCDTGGRSNVCVSAASVCRHARCVAFALGETGQGAREAQSLRLLRRQGRSCSLCVLWGSALKVVYIAGPFRGPNAWEIEQNIRRAEALALEVWKIGAACLCPHTNTRFFQGAADDSVWLDGDLELLARCDAVLLTPDWERSSGARAEVEFAVKRGIRIFYDLRALSQWLDYDAFPVPRVHPIASLMPDYDSRRML